MSNTSIRRDFAPNKSSPLKGKQKAVNQDELEESSQDEQEQEEGEDDEEEEDEDESEEEDEVEERNNNSYSHKSKNKVKGKMMKRKRTELDQEGGIGGNEEKGWTNNQIFTKQFLTASTGDKYLLANSTTGNANKTSNNLLSNSIKSEFTLESFYNQLYKFDSTSTFTTSTSTSTTTITNYTIKFPKWHHELTSGFNLLFYGFGSKFKVLNLFAEYCRSKGNVVVINGFDSMVTLNDLVEALEGLIKVTLQEQEEGEEEEEEEEEVQGGNRKKRKKNNAATSKSNKNAPLPLPQYKPTNISSIESRIRKFCLSLSSLSTSSRCKDIYIVIHNLDSTFLRSPKTLSLLALLASQSRIHLISSVDHLRASFLFPINLTTTRPPYSTTTPQNIEEASTSASASTNPESRTFTFIYHEMTTLQPYTLELSHSPLLSSLLPPSIYPTHSASSNNSNSNNSSNILQSITYILSSVTSKSKKLFLKLAQSQLNLLNSLPSSTLRSLILIPTSNQNLIPTPIIATNLNSFADLALDSLLVSHADQVTALLAEFRDHNVILGSLIAPLAGEGEEEGEGEGEGGGEEGGEWIWICMGKEGLEGVCKSLEEGA